MHVKTYITTPSVLWLNKKLKYFQIHHPRLYKAFAHPKEKSLLFHNTLSNCQEVKWCIYRITGFPTRQFLQHCSACTLISITKFQLYPSFTTGFLSPTLLSKEPLNLRPGAMDFGSKLHQYPLQICIQMIICYSGALSLGFFPARRKSNFIHMTDFPLFNTQVSLYMLKWTESIEDIAFKLT